MKVRKTVVCMCVLLLLASGLCFAAGRQAAGPDPANYPTRTIRFIVNRGPGGGSDTMTRFVAASLERVLGCSTVVVNMDGGDGVVGKNAVFAAAPDGYTLMVTAPTEIAHAIVNGHGVRFNETGFTSIAGINVRGSILAVRRGSEIRNIDDLIRISRQRPGSVTVGIPGGGNMQQALDLMEALDVTLTVVNAGSGGNLFAQVLGGHIEMGLIGAQFYQRFIDEGLAVIAQTVEIREHGVPTVPTLVEMGYQMVADNRMFLGGPANMPDNVVRVLSDAMDKLFVDPEFIEGIRKMGETPKFMNRAELAAYHTRFYAEQIPRLRAARAAAN